MFELLAASAVVPSLLLIWYFHRRDVNPEPGRVVWTTFFLGVLTVIPVLLVDWPIAAALGHPASPIAAGFGEAFFVAAIPEEFFKFLVLWLYASRHKEFDEPMDGIVYGAIASLGFATFENILYVSSGGFGAALMRAITAVPGHAFMGAIAGYYVGQAKFAPQRRVRLMVQGYLTAVILHGLYDAGLLSMRAMAHGGADADTQTMGGALVLVTLVVFVFEWVWAVRLVRRLREQQLEIAGRQQSAAAMMAMVQPATPMAMAAGGYAPPAYGATPSAPYGGASPSPYGAPASSPYGSAQSPYAAPPSAPAYGSPFAPQYAVSAPYASPATAEGRLGAWLKLILGGLFASIGGLITLAVLIGIGTGASAQQETGSLIIGTIAIGVLPLVIGLYAFARGMKGLSPTSVPAVAYAVNPYGPR